MAGSEIAALVFGVTLILVSAFVILLRPIARQLTDLVTAFTQQGPCCGPDRLSLPQDRPADSDRRLGAIEERLCLLERVPSETPAHTNSVDLPVAPGRLGAAQERQS